MCALTSLVTTVQYNSSTMPQAVGKASLQ